MEEDLDKVRDKRFQTFKFFGYGYPLYFIEDFRDLIDILIDM